MPPAFDSTKQAAAFALLLLFLLAAPWLAHKTFLPLREHTYSSESLRWEKFPWVQKFIFQETNDIDIAFVGSSHIGMAIDTPYVQQKLDEQLGHQSVVRTLCFYAPGFDSLYFFTRDLLAHRHVKMLVFYDECSDPVPLEVEANSPYWFRFGEDGGVMAGLPFKDRAIYYYAAVIGMPRNFLELFISNLPSEPHDQMNGPFAVDHAANPELHLGAVTSQMGFNPSYGRTNTQFAIFAPKNDARPEDVCVFTPANATNIIFSDWNLSSNQVYFAKQFASLAKTNGCQLVELHLPLFAERASPAIAESRNWPALMQANVCLMGIPPPRLFAGLSEKEIMELYLDPGHLNANGQKYFTALVTPALLQFYENHANH